MQGVKVTQIYIYSMYIGDIIPPLVALVLYHCLNHNRIWGWRDLDGVCSSASQQRHTFKNATLQKYLYLLV